MNDFVRELGSRLLRAHHALKDAMESIHRATSKSRHMPPEVFGEMAAVRLGFMVYFGAKLTLDAVDRIMTFRDESASAQTPSLDKQRVVWLELATQELRSSLYELMQETESVAYLSPRPLEEMPDTAAIAAWVATRAEASLERAARLEAEGEGALEALANATPQAAAGDELGDDDGITN